MIQKRYYSSTEATSLLGISHNTLYSYVSRGLIRSEETSESSRQKRYLAEDIHALQQRKERRLQPETIAISVLDFGEPVLESALTLIRDSEFYYRGHNATRLADRYTFEEVTALLWTGTLSAELFNTYSAQSKREEQLYVTARPLLQMLTPVEAFRILLPLAEAADLAAHDFSPTSVTQTGIRLLHLMVRAITGDNDGSPIARQLQQYWAPEIAPAVPLLDAALILCADHELNASSFTARCVASTNSTPYAAVSAGLAALQGTKHGGHTLRCETFLREAIVHPRNAIVNRLNQGEAVPGFGHRLYPDRDPRGQYLLEIVEKSFPTAPALRAARTLCTEMGDSFGLYPNLDFGLVLLASVLNLPPGSSLTLFALGRISGWIAHTIEQYQQNRMIRPRAKYIGVRPQSPGIPDSQDNALSARIDERTLTDY